jgi:hypothetical protein
LFVIEFAGAACTGKTTLMWQVQKRLSAEGTACTAVDARWFRKSRRAVLRALADPRIALWCLLNPTIALKERCVHQLLSGIGVVRRLRADGGVLLLDEGPVRTYQDVAVHNPRGARLIRAAAPQPDLMVIMTCDPLVRLKRVRAEDRPDARGRPDEAVLARQMDEGVARAFARARGIRVIALDTTEGVDAEDVLKELRPWLAPPRKSFASMPMAVARQSSA